jgi:HPt (histidine-containing phosphotransfer) domain-containing protein
MGDDADEMRDILKIYIDQMSINLNKLGCAIESANAANVDMIAHNCAGVSANCGMTAVIEPLKRLEKMGRANQLDGAAELLDIVNTEFARVHRFLEEKLYPINA